MLLLIGPARDGRHNTYNCRGSERQIEPLGLDVFDVVSNVLEIQESQLCSCLRKCNWNANTYHNDVHCTYCKHKTKRRISGIESPLHSCWDKITVKNRRGGGGGVPERLEPTPGYAPVSSPFGPGCSMLDSALYPLNNSPLFCLWIDLFIQWIVIHLLND